MNLRTWSAALVALVIFAPSVWAQSYPDRPVRVVANQPPGGASDLVTRLAAEAMSEVFGKPFIVENRAGASGAIGLQAVAQSLADGHALLVSASTIAINPAISSNTTYSLEGDVMPIAQIARGPYMVVVAPNIPASDAKELGDYARRRPQSLRWGLSNVGAGDHLAIALFNREAKIDTLLVPYRGAGPAMTGLLAGEVDAVMFPVSVVMPQVTGGKLKAVGVTSSSRIDAAPNVKTIAEAGFPGFEFETWFGLWGPKGMTADRVETIRNAIAKGFDQPKFKERLSAAALLPGNMDTSWFRTFIGAELKKYDAIAKENNIRAE